MTMVTASTALTIFIMNIHHCGPEARPVPKWAECLILKFLAKICCVNEVGESCLGSSSRKQPLSQEESDEQDSGGGRGANWDVNGQAWGGRVEEGETKQTVWKEDLFVTVDHSEENEATGRREEEEEHSHIDHEGRRGAYVEEKKGVGGAVEENRREIWVRTKCVCQHQRLLKSVEYIAMSYQDQRTAQVRISEWRKVAKVMDRFFMWLFFIMFFLMSIVILGKAL